MGLQNVYPTAQNILHIEASELLPTKNTEVKSRVKSEGEAPVCAPSTNGCILCSLFGTAIQ